MGLSVAFRMAMALCTLPVADASTVTVRKISEGPFGVIDRPLRTVARSQVELDRLFNGTKGTGKPAISVPKIDWKP